MKSHETHFAWRDLLVLAGGPLVPLVLFALLMHLGAAFKLLPDPIPALDTDRTILFHQADASRSKQNADLLLIGDSSCLMDVSARQLETALKGTHRVLNLGTLSYLDLNADASLLRNFVSANPGQLRAVVLLMHPEGLRQAAPSDYHISALEHFFQARDFCDPSASRIGCWLGADIFKGRLLARAVPVPLSGDYGRAYGFTSDLWRFLSEHQGSALDPKTFDRRTAQGDAEYRLAKKLETSSQVFKSAVPPRVKLFVGITPAPESFVTRPHRERCAAMLRQWSEWLQADMALTNLPATLPDSLFASTTHLNAAGQRVFTERLAGSLSVK